MGAKIALKCIEDDKNRKYTFTRRSKVLKKKVDEFVRMFDDVEACLIVYDGNENVQPMIWPEDLTRVHSIIDEYQLHKNEGSVEDFNMRDFYNNKINMVKVEISKVKKHIYSIKYPTWDPSFSSQGMEQLGSFTAMLNARIEECDQRINVMKNKNEIEANFNLPTSMNPINGSDSVVDLTNQVQVTTGSTHDVNVDGAIQHDKFEDIGNQLCKDANKVANPDDEFEDLANQLDDLKEWTWSDQQEFGKHDYYTREPSDQNN